MRVDHLQSPLTPQLQPLSARQVQNNTAQLLVNTTHYTLHPAPYTLHPTPYTLHPAPYTQHPTPCNSHTTPYNIHPKAEGRRGGRCGAYLPEGVLCHLYVEVFLYEIRHHFCLSTRNPLSFLSFYTQPVISCVFPYEVRHRFCLSIRNPSSFWSFCTKSVIIRGGGRCGAYLPEGMLCHLWQRPRIQAPIMSTDYEYGSRVMSTGVLRS